MLGFFMKDLRYVRTQAKLYLILAVMAVGLCFFMEDGDSYAMVYCGIIGLVLSINSLNYDAHDNGYAFLLSLPITRKSYVVGKYLLAISAVGCSAVFLYLLCCLKNQGLYPVSGALWMMFVDLVVLCTMLPIHIIFGAEKSRIIIILIGVLGGSLPTLAKRSGADVTALAQRFAGLSQVQVALMAVAVFAVLFGGSLLISIKGMERKKI